MHRFLSFSSNPSAKAFSLIEIMMQIALLATVTIPILMMLNGEKGLIEKNRTKTINQIIANQLLDNVIIQHPQVQLAYNVDFDPPNNITSVYCDPATKNLNQPDYYRLCTGNGAYVNRPPFFKRDGYSRVDIYNSKDADPTKPDFSLERQVEIGSQRIHFESTLDPLADYQNISAPNYRWNQYFFNNLGFGLKTKTDDEGHFWYPMPDPSSTIDPEFTNYYFTYNTGCSPGSSTTPVGWSDTNPRLFKPLYLTSSNCAEGVSLYFIQLGVHKDRATYDVTLYFNYFEHSATDPNTGQLMSPTPVSYNCLSNTHQVSCALADVEISGYNFGNGDEAPIKTYRNFDYYTASGRMKEQGTALHTSFKMPSSFHGLKITVKPTVPDSGTTEVHLTAVEIVPRRDQ